MYQIWKSDQLEKLFLSW